MSSFESQPAGCDVEAGGKVERWKELEKEVDGIVDRLGIPIDEGIKPLVVALKAKEFGTTGSCEGHSDESYPHPWVDIESKLAEKVYSLPRYFELAKKFREERKGKNRTSEDERREWQRMLGPLEEANREAYERLIQLLDEFNREAVGDWGAPRLHVSVYGWYTSRIEPEDVPDEETQATVPDESSEESKRVKLSKYQREIKRLEAWLRRRYMSGRL